MMKWTVLSDNRSNDNRLSTEHGLSVLIQTERYKILLDTGASNALVGNVAVLGENILAACPHPVKYVVGGFHLLDGQESEAELLALAGRLKDRYPTTQFYTSHCTGDSVYEVMKSVMQEQLQSFRCGTTIEVSF